MNHLGGSSFGGEFSGVEGHIRMWPFGALSFACFNGAREPILERPSWFPFRSAPMTSDEKPVSPLDDLLAKMQNHLHARRCAIDTHLAPIEFALAAYRRALEAQAASEYAAHHQLPKPDLSALSPRIAAFNLMRTVEALREMPKAAPAVEESPEALEPRVQRSSSVPVGPDEELPMDVRAASEEKAVVRSLDSALPKIVDACDNKKLVIVGALAGRKRSLPDPLDRATEWVDTSDGGAHAIGNLPTRIRQGRIFAVIICDQSISHQHSEPVVTAARGARIPVGFAGKGGGGAIGRALKVIEEQL